MQESSYTLSKGCIKAILEGGHASTILLLQVVGIDRRTLTLSDGVWTIDALRASDKTVQKFDVIALTKYSVERIKNTSFVFIKEFEVMVTDIPDISGSPAEWLQQNPKETEIVSAISSASSVPEQPAAKIEELKEEVKRNHAKKVK